MKKLLADIDDVTNRIEKNIHNENLAEKLIDKMENYVKTKNNRDDISNQEANLIYRNVDFDDVEQLSKKRKLDIDWTGHGKYRSELRDINHDDVNELVTDRMKNILINPKKKKKDVKKFKAPGTGTTVVDYDLTKKPGDADIVTVYGKLNTIAKQLI